MCGQLNKAEAHNLGHSQEIGPGTILQQLQVLLNEVSELNGFLPAPPVRQPHSMFPEK